MTIARASLILVTLLGAGCPGPGTPAAGNAARTCDDVAAAAARLDVTSAARRPRPSIAARGPVGTWFGQGAPEPDPVPEPVMAEPPQDVAAIWRDECVDDAWPQATIDCFTSATSEGQARECVTASPVAAPPAPADPACVAAAEHGAEILANDIGASGDRRADVLARARAAILAPCVARRFSDELLECLSDPELTESFGICGFGMTGKPDWDALVESLGAEGFGGKQ